MWSGQSGPRARQPVPALAPSALAGCALFGGRNYFGPVLMARLAANSQHLVTPPARQAKHDPEVARSKKWACSVMRCLIDTVFSQLVDRYQFRRVWAEDLVNLTNLVYRKVLAHTLALILNMEQDNRPLQFEQLLQA